MWASSSDGTLMVVLITLSLLPAQTNYITFIRLDGPVWPVSATESVHERVDELEIITYHAL